LTLKKFLNILAEDGRYYAEMVEDLAEIYYLSDNRPSVLVEFNKNVFHVNFRSDLTPNVAAQISHDMSKVNSSIVIEAPFAISEDKGVVYGDEAMGTHYLNIFFALQSSSAKNSEETKDAIFVVKDPIRAFSGKRQPRSDKLYRKLWGEK
jgi:hypothetical protein